MPHGIEGIVVFRVPHISHGCVTVTNVRNSVSAHALGDCMARADDEIESPQIPRFDSRREERQKVSIVAVNTRDSIQPGGNYAMRFDAG